MAAKKKKEGGGCTLWQLFLLAILLGLVAVWKLGFITVSPRKSKQDAAELSMSNVASSHLGLLPEKAAEAAASGPVEVALPAKSTTSGDSVSEAEAAPRGSGSGADSPTPSSRTIGSDGASARIGASATPVASSEDGSSPRSERGTGSESTGAGSGASATSDVSSDVDSSSGSAPSSNRVTGSPASKAAPEYEFLQQGVAGPNEIWNFGDAMGKGVEFCYQAVMDEDQCAKDYFSYVQRGDKNCGCKGAADVPLMPRTDGASDIYRVLPLDGEEAQPSNKEVQSSESAPRPPRPALRPSTRKASRSGKKKATLGCSHCCNDGMSSAPCFDVDACAANAPEGGRYAFVYAQTGQPGWPWLTFIDSMREQALALEEETGGTSELVMMMPAEDAKGLSCRQRLHLKRYSVRLIEVPWTIPPDCWYPKPYWWPGKKDGWCGPQDLMRLHVLGLEEYDAAVFYDQDVEFQGNMRPVMRCAAQGYFISASGGVGEPFNVGFFALRPDKRLLRAAEIFGGNSSFSVDTGWNKCGFAPANNKFVGAECGQGYFHTLFYKKCKSLQKALKAAGVEIGEDGRQKLLQAVQVDRCIWNYQQDGDCGGNSRFNCSLIRVHHKPTGKPQDARQCGKLIYHHGGWSGPPRTAPYVPPPMPAASATSGASGASECQPQCVSIGKNCKCSGPGPNHIKIVPVKGKVKSCREFTKSSSGDAFKVKVSADAASIVVTRIDAQACWCDDIDVECCITPDPAL